MEKKQPTPGEIAILAGGAAALIGSFLDFAGSSSAWGKGLFLIATLVPIYAVLTAVLVALKFANVSVPERIAGFTQEQLVLVLGILGALMALCWLIAAEDLGIGFWLVLLGSAAVCAGAFLLQKERATGALS